LAGWGPPGRAWTLDQAVTAALNQTAPPAPPAVVPAIGVVASGKAK
jgi:hypothetical protein